MALDAANRAEPSTTPPSVDEVEVGGVVEEQLAQARRVAEALRVTEERRAALRAEMVREMRLLHDLGVAWTEIGRIFSCTPQAAMYATGHAKRAPRK